MFSAPASAASAEFRCAAAAAWRMPRATIPTPFPSPHRRPRGFLPGTGSAGRWRPPGFRRAENCRSMQGCRRGPRSVPRLRGACDQRIHAHRDHQLRDVGAGVEARSAFTFEVLALHAEERDTRELSASWRTKVEKRSATFAAFPRSAIARTDAISSSGSWEMPAAAPAVAGFRGGCLASRGGEVGAQRHDFRVRFFADFLGRRFGRGRQGLEQSVHVP